MIISCPSCEARFRVDEARLGPNGKSVRCSKCGHVWLAAPGGPNAPEISAANQPADVPEPKLSVREPDDGQDADEAGPSESQEAAPQKAPRSRSWFWIKVLLIFIVVAGLLLLFQKIKPMLDELNAGPTVETPAADVGEVEAKPAQ